MFLPLILVLALAQPAAAQPAQTPKPLHLKDGDRIALVGGTLIEREQRYGYWETLLLLQHPELRLQVRNLGWSGDTVYGDARAGFGTQEDGYKLLKAQIFAVKPTVIVIAYGGNEAFDRVEKLPRFRAGILRLLKDLAPLKARILLLAPIVEVQKLSDKMQHIWYFGEIKDIAGEQRLLFHDMFDRRNYPAGWTHFDGLAEDGIQLSERGYQKTAQGFCQAFAPGDEPSSKAATAKLASGGAEELRKTIVAKNELYFYRYRPQNETYLFGFRKHEQGKNAKEVDEFDKLVADAEARIAKLIKQVK